MEHVLRRLTAFAAELRRKADEAEIFIEEVKVLAAPSDPLLGLKKIKERYGCGRWAITSAIDRKELSATEGPHNREYLVRQSEMERWLTSKPYTPRKAKAAEWNPDAEAEAQFQRVMGARGA